jgi:glyoxylase-like metal-dependent hydrolase (beta-lactamase superfamily II)
MRSPSTRALIATLLLAAAPLQAAPERRLPDKAQVTLTPGDPTIGTYVSVERGFTTSSYWIEGPKGLIFIDTQFLLSAAEESIDWAEKVTGKKVQLAIVLHPNPDKFNGTQVFQKRGIKVVTADQVIQLIPAVHKDRYESFYERFKPDYPADAPVLASFGDHTTELSAGGVTVKAHVLGQGASGAHVVVEYHGALFPGDLVANLHHSWLEIGKTEEWLKRLDEMRALKPEFIYPGRGPAGGAELLDREEAYLRKVIEIVKAEKPKGTPTDETVERIKAKIQSAYPFYGNSYFLYLGIPAEWDRQVLEARQKPKHK